MAERTVTMKGNPLALAGDEIKAGDKAPGFTVVNTGLKPKTMSDYAGKVLILASVPSLDTDVCSIETRRFNKEVAELPGEVELLTVSMDLPFAQSRWTKENEVENLTTLSDHREASFGMAYGVLIKELRLLARAVFVVDASGEVAYAELVREVTDEPDYEQALAAARALL